MKEISEKQQWMEKARILHSHFPPLKVTVRNTRVDIVFLCRFHDFPPTCNTRANFHCIKEELRGSFVELY